MRIQKVESWKEKAERSKSQIEERMLLFKNQEKELIQAGKEIGLDFTNYDLASKEVTM